MSLSMTSLPSYKKIQKLFESLNRRMTFGKKAQIEFLDDFNQMQPIVGAPLRILDYMANNSESAGRVSAAKSIAQALRMGLPISEGMKGWFSYLLIESVRIGESKGVLHDVLCAVLEKEKKQQTGLSSAFKPLIYPFIMLSVSLVATISADKMFIPVALKVVKNDFSRLTSEMKALHDTAQFLVGPGLLLPFFIIAVIFIAHKSLSSYVGKYRRSLDMFPVFSTYKLILGANFMQLYSILKAARETEMPIIKICMMNANPYYKMHLRSMLRRINAGEENVANIIDTGLIAKSEIERFRLLSASKEFSTSLEVGANKVFESTLNNLTKLARYSSYVIFIIAGYFISNVLLSVLGIAELV